MNFKYNTRNQQLRFFNGEDQNFRFANIISTFLRKEENNSPIVPEYP